MTTYRINSGVGIIGSMISTVKKNGDSKRVEITTTGSMNAHLIPAVIVLCEDELTKEIITHSLHGMTTKNGASHCSFKYIINGSWENIIISLAGSLLYSDELRKTGNTKVLSTVGVIDGDIPSMKVSEVISKCYKGDAVPSNLKEIIKRIEENITHFKIPESILKERMSGKPEYNIKSMLEEIDADCIDEILRPRMNELTSFLEKSKKENITQAIDAELFFLKKEKEETLKIIQTSKGIGKIKFKTFKQGKYTLDYHKYFSLLRDRIGNEQYITYHPQSTLFMLYKIINKFNKNRWDAYVSPVIDFLIPIAELQRERFSHNTYNNDIID